MEVDMNFLTGAAVGFQIEDSVLIDESGNELVPAGVFVLYLFFVEILFFWYKR